jgi:hypothetical protein
VFNLLYLLLVGRAAGDGPHPGEERRGVLELLKFAQWLIYNGFWLETAAGAGSHPKEKHRGVRGALKFAQWLSLHSGYFTMFFG